jgi:hypothetical protein
MKAGVSNASRCLNPTQAQTVRHSLIRGATDDSAREALGLPYATFQHTRHADNTDALEARAMNSALYPGTLGYYARELLTPPIEDRDKIYRLRQFMVDYVSGRGPLSALRVGQQPYGVLPTTAISRITWYDREVFIEVPPLPRLLPIILERLAILRQTWAELSQQSARVGFGTDPDQTMLDILTLHPTPAEIFMRHAATATYSRNYLILNALTMWRFRRGNAYRAGDGHPHRIGTFGCCLPKL